jgi:hypothetical protein
MAEPRDVGDSPASQRTIRTGAIELFQVLSLVVLAASWLLRRAPVPVPLRWLAIVLGVTFFAVPFFLVALPRKKEDARFPEGPHGFKITSERRRTLAELKIPKDILQTIDKSFIDRHFHTGEELRESLYVILGKPRVRPWAYTILLHAQVYLSRLDLSPSGSGEAHVAENASGVADAATAGSPD